jgi:integrase/recombinase XerD
MTVAISRLSVIVYTRHSSKCPKKDIRYWRRCHCPKWLYINENGQRTLKSAKTRSWDRADELGRSLERELELLALQHPGGNSHRPRPVTLAKHDEGSITLATAIARFLAAKKNENLEEATISKLTTIFQKKMLSWAASEQIKELDKIGAPELERFRETWKDAPLARKKKQERVVGFFYYCFRMGWIKTNPAVLLGKIRVREQPTDYFPKEEFEKIIQATYIYKPKAWNAEPGNQATRVRTLIRLMRWSGLSIRDAVGLERSRLTNEDELFLYRAKTRHPVYVPLPPDLATDLRNIPPGPKPNPRYFFWSGNGKLRSAVGDWQRSLRRVFALAAIKLADGIEKRCHPHMLRDTFAVEGLLAGLTLEQVSILLGHKSVRTTEKHYAPWVKARQEQLAENVRRTWKIGHPILKSQQHPHGLQN